MTNVAPSPWDSSARPSDPPSGTRLRRDDGDGDAWDEGAFRAFVAAQYDRMWAWACVLNLTHHDTEDIAQDALVCLWQRRRVVRKAGWPGWLCNAMVLRGRMHLRSRGRRQKYEVDFALHSQDEANDASPEIERYARECEGELRRLVEGLRPERRAVVQRYLLDELPMAQVAAELRIGEETAQKRWRLAQADMRATYGRDRAGERFRAAIAGFVAFFAVFWARLGGEARAATLAEGCGPRPSPRAPSGAAATSRAWLAGVGVARSPRLLLAGWLGLVLALSVVTHAPSRGADLAFSLDEAAVRPAPLLPLLGVVIPGWAERERGRSAPNPALVRVVSESSARRKSKLPRVLLTQASAAYRDGRIAAARSLLATYKMAFPDLATDPFRSQYEALAAALGAN